MGKWRGKFGIAAVLTLAFGGLIAISTGTLLFLSLGNALETTRNSLGSKLETLIRDAAQQSEAFFEPTQVHAGWLSQEIAAGRINLDDTQAIKSILTGAVSTLPQIAAVSFQKPDGKGFFFDANANTLKTVEWPKKWQVRLNRSEQNPQTAPSSDGLWVLRPSVIDGEPASTFIIPARTPTGDVGVVAVRIDPRPLSESLATNATFRDFELVRFILFNKRIVLGHPQLQQMPDVIRPSIDDLSDPYLKQLAEGKRSELKIVAEIPGVDTFVLGSDEGERIFALMDDDSRQSGGGEFSIGVHFDPAAGDAELNRLITIASIGISLFIGSILFAIFLGQRAAAPMRQLAEAAQLVQENKLEKVEVLPVSSVKELASATTAFNGMVAGMKEREKIRDLFGKYVPQDVANLLLTDDTTGEPRNATATVLFLDIEGFSSISEKLTPREVVETMNAFFSDAVHLIEEEGGMVTQFQGDAILAVFNVPVPMEDHAASAIRASLSILKKIKTRDYAGHTLNCRIGLNTGPLVAGAIGAQDRLNYTVYGDAVNVAARLEQMNKEFGTRLLVAAGTTELAEGFDFKLIGEVPIRGREMPVEVFTLDDE